MPGTALQFGGAGALDDDEARADRGDVDAPDGRAVLGVQLKLAGQVLDPPALLVQARKLELGRLRRGGAVERVQIAAEAFLFELGEQR